MKQPKEKQAGSYYEEMSEEIQVMSFQSKQYTHKADLFGPIYSPAQFSQIVNILDNMKEGDEFVLNLCSGGGSLSAVDNLLHAINKTEGHVHIVATGSIASAATLVLLSGDSFELSEGFEALLHNGSLGVGGNFNEVAIQTPFALKHMESYLRRHYEHFLNEQELNDLFKGIDIVLGPEEWCERAVNRIKIMQDKLDEEIEALKNPPKPKRVRKPKKISDKSIDNSEKPTVE